MITIVEIVISLCVKMHSSYTHRHTHMITQTQRSSPDSSLPTPTEREGFHGCTGSSSHTSPEVGLFPQSAPLSMAPGMNIFQRGVYYLDFILRATEGWGASRLNALWKFPQTKPGNPIKHKLSSIFFLTCYLVWITVLGLSIRTQI